jgi:hypothetical protein
MKNNVYQQAHEFLEQELTPVCEEMRRLQREAQFQYMDASQAHMRGDCAGWRCAMDRCNEALAQFHSLELGQWERFNRLTAFRLGVGTPTMVQKTLGEMGPS